QRSLKMFNRMGSKPRIGGCKALQAQLSLWKDNLDLAISCATEAWQLASVGELERDFVRSARLQGETTLRLGNIATAEERLHHALTRARGVNFVEEELPALTALAELHRRKKEASIARELLTQVWDAAERGPFPLFHADALNVLAQIERDA